MKIRMTRKMSDLWRAFRMEAWEFYFEHLLHLMSWQLQDQSPQGKERKALLWVFLSFFLSYCFLPSCNRSLYLGLRRSFLTLKAPSSHGVMFLPHVGYSFFTLGVPSSRWVLFLHMPKLFPPAAVPVETFKLGTARALRGTVTRVTRTEMAST